MDDNADYTPEEVQRLIEQYQQDRRLGYSDMEVDDFLAIADYYEDRSQLKESMAAVDFGLKCYPFDVDLVAFKARHAMFYEKDTEKAKRLAKQITDKNDLTYFYLVAEIMLNEGKAKAANDYLKKQMKNLYDDELDDFVLDAAQLFYDYEEFRKAEWWVGQSALTDDEQYLKLKAGLAFSKGQHKQGAETMEQLLDKDPYSTEGWNMLASSQFKQCNMEEAVDSSEYSIAINPNDAEAVANKAQALFAMNKWEESAACYDRYIALRPNESYGYSCKGFAMQHLDRLDEALELYKKAEELDKDHPENLLDVYESCVAIYSDNADWETALAYADKIEAAGNKSAACLQRAYIALKKGDLPSAQDFLCNAIHAADDVMPAIHKSAVMALDFGYPSKAIELYEELFQGAPADWNEGYSYYAIALRELGEMDKWRKAVKTAVAKNPFEAKIALQEYFPEGMHPEQYYNYLVEHKEA